MERLFKNFFLITESVDNLHRNAGNKNIIELHGNIYIFKCTKCNEMVSGIIENIDSLPKCKKCSASLRPNVVLFGEEVNQKLLSKSQEISSSSDVFISAGTSRLIDPAASLPYLAKAKFEGNLKTK